MAAEIRLNDGFVALVDEVDVEAILNRPWRAFRAASGLVYARSGKRSIYMHHLILPRPEGMLVDHANGNGLDNRRGNLRLCTHAENMRNRRPQGGTSRFKGVWYRPDTAKWRAGITLDGRTISLGTYRNERDAAAAYDAAAMRHFGAFAATNASLGLL